MKVYQLQSIVQPLLKWYQKNKRILPWRVERETDGSVWIVHLSDNLT